MFGSLLGRKFSNKCKHSIKRINCRIVPIKKKKQATVTYLKKVVAELLSKGEDTNAFGRIDALVVEINHTSCYEMIEQYCEFILKQLSSLQKQRECPDEATEALSTLIFAAARFSDLPELYDLRHVFTERYGGHMESYVNSEFVEKMQKKSFPSDKKLQLMQDIAQEFSVRWNSKAFQQKMSNPLPAPASNQPKRAMPICNGNDEVSHLEINEEEAIKGRKEAVISVGNPDIPSKGSCEPPRRSVMQKQQVQPEPREIHVIPSISNGRPRDLAEKTRKVTADDEPENVEPHYANTGVPPYVKPKGSQSGTHKDVQLNEGSARSKSPRAQERPGLIGLEKQAGRPVISREVKAVNMIPPYTKSKEGKNGTGAQEQHASDSADDELLKAKEGLDQESRSVKLANFNGDRAFNMIPPYTKPKFRTSSALADHNKPTDVPIHSSNTEDCNRSNGGVDEGHLKDKLIGDERPRPISVRRKYPKPPVVGEVDSVTDDAKLVSRTPSGRSKGGRRSTSIYDDGCNEAEKIVDRHPKQTAANDMDGDVNHEQHMTRTPSGRRRQGRRWHAAATYDGDCDDEEAAMDRLLIHYSKRGMSNESSKTRSRTKAPPTDLVCDAGKVVEDHHHHHRYHHGNDKIHHGPAESVVSRPQRTISLPPEPTSPPEEVAVAKGPARAASMQPDILSPNGRRVHPRLPDYDELAARVKAQNF